jgi:hypothetical protein
VRTTRLELRLPTKRSGSDGTASFEVSDSRVVIEGRPAPSMAWLVLCVCEREKG